MISFPDEPALPKKTIERNRWTEQEIGTLMSMAAAFTDQGRRVRWREIASATGHHESSCALKYHVIRSRTAGRLARELIDADLAVKDPVKRSANAGAYPVWSGEEDTKLLAACRGNIIRGESSWVKIAEGFPGRSSYAVRQRYLTLRNWAASIVPDRDRKSPPLRPQKRAPAVKKAPPQPPPHAEHTTLTSAFFGDPLPGRSALDRLRAGIADEPFVDHRKAQQDRFAKITLPSVPLR